jgi:hypothetical protein
MTTSQNSGQSSTLKIPLFEKSSNEAMSFADFVAMLRVTPSPRGDLIAIYKTLINARTFPRIASWSDLYRLMTRRAASPDALNEARKLWAAYKSNQSTAVVSPTHNAEGTSNG